MPKTGSKVVNTFLQHPPDGKEKVCGGQECGDNFSRAEILLSCWQIWDQCELKGQIGERWVVEPNAGRNLHFFSLLFRWDRRHSWASPPPWCCRRSRCLAGCACRPLWPCWWQRPSCQNDRRDRSLGGKKEKKKNKISIWCTVGWVGSAQLVSTSYFATWKRYKR